MRHATAGDEPPGASDHERKLDPEGLAEATRIASLLETRPDPPQLVLCSSAVRAVETLRQLSASLPASHEVRIEDDLYLASSGALLSAIEETEHDCDSLLVVAHNPGVSELALDLVPASDQRARSRIGLGFAPASLARLAFEGEWAELRPHRAQLLEFTRPGELE